MSCCLIGSGHIYPKNNEEIIFTECSVLYILQFSHKTTESLKSFLKAYSGRGANLGSFGFRLFSLSQAVP